MKTILTYVISILVTELSGFAVGMLTRSGTQAYAESITKPPLSPPGIVFPIAWTILYGLMGIGLARVLLAESSEWRTRGIILYVVQLVLNLAWCFIFFSAKRYDLAFFELVIMFAAVVAMSICFRKVDKPSQMMQIPYLCWLVFAGYLNSGVWFLQ
ncbi:MAG: tryptophan-rich sensory protein [Lachnospiraceae bacterium]|nr:tryptophan-rich sensory protein [Lachnospiraceae bacterium]